jgi:hypothetical protein
MEVSPPQGNDFQAPLILTANMSDVDGFDYDHGTVVAWDGSNWGPIVDVAAHPNQQNIVAHLDHLANCKVTTGGGKKGKIGA